MKAIILLLSVLAYASSFNLRATKQNYDSYVFAVQWANGFCKVNGCGGREKVVETNTMTIHGLWPSLKSGKMLDTCTTGVDVRDTGSALFQQLRKVWPSLNSPNEKFWNHEYNKHGYCMVQENDWDGYEDYFEFVIDLFEKDYKYLIQKAFPNPAKKLLDVTLKEMTENIRKVIPDATFKMNCKSGYIYEMYFYLEKDNFEPSTDSRFSGSCSGGKLVFQ